VSTSGHVGRVTQGSRPLSGWTGPTRRSTRAWASVILPKTVKDDLLRDVEEFMSDEERSWYAAVGESSVMVYAPTKLKARHSASSRVRVPDISSEVSSDRC